MEGISTPCVWAKHSGFIGLGRFLKFVDEQMHIGVSYSCAGYVAPGGNGKFMCSEDSTKKQQQKQRKRKKKPTQ